MAIFTPGSHDRADSNSRRTGFTIIELMVALTVGGLAISSMYAIGSATTRQFYSQQQVASAQTALRMALNQVKRDIARAGYLSTPNVTVVNPTKPLQTCAAVVAPLNTPGGRLAAFSRFANDVPIVAGVNDAIDPTGTNRLNGFTADDVVLFANYETSDEYPGIGLVNPTTISVGQLCHSFARDFTNWSQIVGLAPADFDAAAFAQAFPVGRLIRIQTTTGLRHFARITGTAAPVAGVSPPTISFNTPIPAACLGGIDQGWVAPVSAIHYVVRNATGDEAPRFAGTTGANGQLVREEVDPDTKLAPLAINGVATPRVILDYVVSFNLAFAMTTDTANGAPDVFVPGVYDNTLAATVNANPQLIRAVQIDLAVRTPEQDPRLTWSQAGCAGMRCFQVFLTADRPGASRVRRMRAEVLVPNVAIEGY